MSVAVGNVAAGDTKGLQIFRNAAAARRGAYRFGNLLSLQRAEQARGEIGLCPQYQPTPLVALADVAADVGVEVVWYKDESPRFGLGSFKALGGAYAVAKLLQESISRRVNQEISLHDVARGRYRELTSQTTVTCATDGNHGRSVAAGAQMFGCKCVIFLHAGVSAAREEAIAAFGASTIRVAGDYDDSVAAAAAEAEKMGWTVVSDTSWPGYERVPCLVMQGYTVMILEIMDRLRASGRAMPTHVFLQGGVGGLAAAVVATFWEALGEAAPTFVIVEPEGADCLYQSARARHPSPARGNLNTIMAGLSCGEVSATAWRILAPSANYFMTIPDEPAVAAMRQLADRKPPIIAGESATAGLAALQLLASGTAELRAEMKLNRSARVLLIGTEGATDPALYERLVGSREP